MSGMHESSLEWLSATVSDPAECISRWQRSEHGAMLLPAGRLWEVLILPQKIGTLALTALLDIPYASGPVLADFLNEKVGFFIPADTSNHWICSGSRIAGKGTWIVVPRPGHSVGGVRWLVPPDASGTLNDLDALEEVLHSTAALLACGNKADRILGHSWHPAPPPPRVP